MSESENAVLNKSFLFAVRVLNFYKERHQTLADYALAKQLLRSGTSIGANVREAQSSESKKDFTHKMSIALKEASEAIYWLELFSATAYLNQAEFRSLYQDANEIHKIISSIILTCKKGLKSPT